MSIDELTVIDRYFRPLAGEGAFRLVDDAARLQVPDGFDLVVTADMIAAGVHFLPGDPSETVAQKALRVNVSDLAAKGATPSAYVLSLGLAAAADETWLAGFAAGLRQDQERYRMHLLGGDTIAVAAGPVVSITAFGLVARGRMVHRFGGRPGDALYLTGDIGASAIGLALLRGEHGPWDALSPDAQTALIRRYRVPDPPAALALTVGQFASAAVDVSDGQVGDCDKLAAASGCSALIEAGDVPLPVGMEKLDERALARLITAGDDYQILAAVPPPAEGPFREAAASAGGPVARIGALHPGSGEPPRGRAGGRPLPLDRRAYAHAAGKGTE